MTFAEFIAAAFWPSVVLFALLLVFTKRMALFRYVFGAALLIGFTYFGLWVADPKSSIFAVLDFYVFGALLGMFGAWKCLRLCVKSYNIRASLLAPVGALLALFNLSILYLDLFEPRVVLEARAQNAHIQPHFRGSEYVVDIAGQSVKATTPIYERLKSNPHVRAEIGPGSNYIYRIDYLAD
jgi:hypothetical protein